MSVSLLRPPARAGSRPSRPARLGVAELLHTTDLAAGEVLDGRYNDLLPSLGADGFSWLGGDDDNVRQAALAVANQIQGFGTCVLCPVAANRPFA